MKAVVIVGVGETVEPVPENLADASSPLDLMAAAAEAALADAGIAISDARIDTIGVVRTFSDSGAPLKSPFGDPVNPPRALAARLGASPERAIYTPLGGQTPQELVNEMATQIAAGAIECALLAGAEALANQKALQRAKMKADWTDPTDGPVEDRGSGASDTVSLVQVQNDLLEIPPIYSLLENARRARLGLSNAAYAERCAELFAPLSQVAASHPAAMFKQALDAQTIATITEDNPPVTDIYSRAMVAKDGVNQGAAILLMSEEKARALGVCDANLIYPAAGSRATDMPITHRERLDDSVALKAAYAAAMERADIAVEDLVCMDLYSCFPIAVFAACEALGIEPNDRRGLTVTGGLPFFGGPGNNYAMHSVVNVVKQLREAGDGYGLVGANGGYLTKHAVGVYSARPPKHGWREADTAALQKTVSEQKSPDLASFPEGEAEIEGFSVSFDRQGPRRGFVIGRLPDGGRFLGSTDRRDKETVRQMLEGDPFSRRIFVTSKGPGNRFTFDPETTAALVPKAPKSLGGAFEYCLVERRGRVLEVTINRPEALNSLTPLANFEMERIFDLYEADRSLWAAIVTGAGDKAFSTGNDLKHTASGEPIWWPETGFGGLTHRRARSKPVIAAINGFAYGGGFEIALSCDIVVADPNARFALPEVKTGLIAAAGGLIRLPRALPRHIAKEMLMTGRSMDAAEARNYGLVNVLSEPGEVLEAARDFAQRICAVSPMAVSTSLKVMESAARFGDPVTALENTEDAIVDVAVSEDLQTGLMSFMTKKAPEWKNR